ncbi:hypothetical protein NZK32_14235 [Cyanobium sp. FGCU-52]|nr:hypothetical protein [Cyanobium sp. FGCU52]
MRRRPATPATDTDPARAALVVRLQILAAVFVPMLLIGIWLQSKGFFQSP